MEWLRKAWDNFKKSATVMLMTVAGIVASTYAMILQFADALNVPEIKQQIVAALAKYPQAVGYVMLTLTVAGILARLRTLGK